jgi:hypothetical protein
MDQRMDALRRANEVRTLRAQLKRDLKAGRVSIGALLLDPPPFLETAKVFDILLALPRHGRVKATKMDLREQPCDRQRFLFVAVARRPETTGNRDRQEGARTSMTPSTRRSARLQRSPRRSPLGTLRNTCKCWR